MSMAQSEIGEYETRLITPKETVNMAKATRRPKRNKRPSICAPTQHSYFELGPSGLIVKSEPTRLFCRNCGHVITLR